MFDDAATVSSCNAQAMQQVKSFSFDGEFNLLAIFPVEGASSPSEKHGWRVFGGMMGPVQ